MEGRDNRYRVERRLVWHVGAVLAAVVMVLYAAGPALALDPPEWLTYKSLLHSVGKTPGVTVMAPIEVGSRYRINVIVEDSARGPALATILAPNDGSAFVVVKVMDSQGNVQKPVAVKGTVTKKLAKIKALFQTAFTGNPFYVTTKTVYVDGIYGVFPIYKAKLIQFACDNAGDYYGNATYVAADLFRLVANQAIGAIYISFTTEQMAAGQ